MKKVAAGDKVDFSARDWNKLADLVNRRPSTGYPAPPRSWGYTWVWVRNDSSADWPRYYAAELLDGLTATGTAAAGDPVFSAHAPSIGTGSTADGLGGVVLKPPAVTLEPIKIGAIGRAIVNGPCRVKIRQPALSGSSGWVPPFADFSRKASSGDTHAAAGQLTSSLAGRFTVFTDATYEASNTIVERWAVLHGYQSPLYWATIGDSVELLYNAMNSAEINGTVVSLWAGHLLTADVLIANTFGCWAVGRPGRMVADVVAFQSPPIPTNPGTNSLSLQTYLASSGSTALHWV